MSKTYYQLSDITFEPKPTHHSFLDLEYHRFNQLYVLGYAGKTKTEPYWYCLCDCGRIIRTQGVVLRRGTTLSCGCYAREKNRILNTTHGEGNRFNPTLEYKSYHSAKDRCNSPRNPDYPRYGGRGIQFKFNTYEEFLSEMGRRPSSKHTLDRRDVNGHYEKGNARWATRKEQSRNRRNSMDIVFDGVSQNRWDWADQLGLNGNTLGSRRKLGWCDECIITQPKGGRCIHKRLGI